MIIIVGAALLFSVVTVLFPVVIFKKNAQLKISQKLLLKEKREQILTKVATLGYNKNLIDVALLREAYLETNASAAELCAVDIAIEAHILEKYALFPKHENIELYIRMFAVDFFGKNNYPHEWAILETLFRSDASVEACFIAKLEQEVETILQQDCNKISSFLGMIRNTKIFIFFKKSDKKYAFLKELEVASVA